MVNLNSETQWSTFFQKCFSQSLKLVEISGIEPLTSWMPFKRSPSWAIPPYPVPQKLSDGLAFCGKPRRLKQSTGLFLRAGFRVHFGSQAFRLSGSFNGLSILELLEVVGQNGLEPSTSRLSVVCSSQLSYWPILPYFFARYILSVPSKLNNVKALNTLYWP